MPRNLIKRFLPNHEKVREHKHLQVFGDWLKSPNLWHLHRRSVAGAFFVGLFWAFVPFPFQMVGAAATAILFQVNLPISVALVWLTNPLTIPPMFYFAYLLGTWVLGIEATVTDFSLSVGWFESVFGEIWEPLLLGSLICGLTLGLLGYGGIRLFWRWRVVKAWRKRQAERSTNSPSTS